MMEKTLAIEKPIMANSAKTDILSATKISAINANTAIIVIILKNFAGEKLTNKIAPINAPAVRKAKYILVPYPAFIEFMPQRSIKIFGAAVFKPTSTPTTNTIPKNKRKIVLSFNKLNTLPNELALVATGSCSIGVAINQIVEIKVITA